MDFNITKSAVKSHAHALFVGADLKTISQTNNEMQQYLLVYFWA